MKVERLLILIQERFEPQEALEATTLLVNILNQSGVRSSAELNCDSEFHNVQVENDGRCHSCEGTETRIK